MPLRPPRQPRLTAGSSCKSRPRAAFFISRVGLQARHLLNGTTQFVAANPRSALRRHALIPAIAVARIPSRPPSASASLSRQPCHQFSVRQQPGMWQARVCQYHRQYAQHRQRRPLRTHNPCIPHPSHRLDLPALSAQQWRRRSWLEQSPPTGPYGGAGALSDFFLIRFGTPSKLSLWPRFRELKGL
jgi:hypothetical protein